MGLLSKEWVTLSVRVVGIVPCIMSPSHCIVSTSVLVSERTSFFTCLNIVCQSVI